MKYFSEYNYNLVQKKNCKDWPELQKNKEDVQYDKN